jgi:DNA mismatch repair ATPase MutL
VRTSVFCVVLAIKLTEERNIVCHFRGCCCFWLACLTSLMCCVCILGTTVTVSDLFKRFPVRRAYCGSTRKYQEVLRQVESCLVAFAVIKPQLRITFRHNREATWIKSATSNVKQALAAVVGSCVVAAMRYIERSVDDPPVKSSFFHYALLRPVYHSLCFGV